ncbi:hypothetical protein LMH87_000066 [Akanthomyces muscarius]|uniref:Vegetative incompatibility protein HET-E-1 n=1 Tax=Akanthomyces muscarius TaxID=2231603 RepID=A0A9W8UKS3_AKAMU|nr:hypothetical protein LMH87_000066 [Akanthomyces muscarius]KAJ4154788.1 hypothetical protein LMH87_000066 [Akanthomyces muscarius]
MRTELGPLAERDPPPDLTPLQPISYSALFWMEHFRSSALDTSSDVAMQEKAADIVYNFVHAKYIYWLEALSLLKGLSNLVKPLRELTRFMASLNLEQHQNLLHDATRFLLAHKSSIEVAPMQVYDPALLLSPSRSLIREIFSDKGEEPEWLTIERGVEENWDVSALTFEGHKSDVRCVAYSHDSQRLASGSEDGIIKIWDSSTGDCLLTIESQTGELLTVAFSHDSRQLVSYCNDKPIPLDSKPGRGAISIWETSTGRMRFRIPTGDDWDMISPIIFSHDSQRLTLKSLTTLHIRDVHTGDCLEKV